MNINNNVSDNQIRETISHYQPTKHFISAKFTLINKSEWKIVSLIQEIVLKIKGRINATQSSKILRNSLLSKEITKRYIQQNESKLNIIFQKAFGKNISIEKIIEQKNELTTPDISKDFNPQAPYENQPVQTDNLPDKKASFNHFETFKRPIFLKDLLFLSREK